MNFSLWKFLAISSVFFESITSDCGFDVVVHSVWEGHSLSFGIGKTQYLHYVSLLSLCRTGVWTSLFSFPISDLAGRLACTLRAFSVVI